jgi:hypothetical protein
MQSRRTNLFIYGGIAAIAVAFPLFLVNFPELGPPIEFVLSGLVIAGGFGFVVAGLLRHDPSLLLTGSGFMLGIAGDYFSQHWMVILAMPISVVGVFWIIRRQEATLRKT